MRIKLAILEKDQSYLNRIVSVFSTKYADKFVIYSFTDMNVALSVLDEEKIDVLVANDAFEIDVNALPKRCGFAYFVDAADIAMENDQRAICKFQKAELIYKQILSVYSENAGSISGLHLGDDSAKILVFTSPSGGTGSSTMAASTAIYFATQGKKTLYLSLEKFGSSDVFFEAEGQFDMSDIVFALKSKKANLGLRLESCVKQDKTGVHFYSQTKVPMDMLELNVDDIERLLSEIKLAASYDYIILDMDFGIDKDNLKIWRQSHGVVWTGDGSETSNTKIYRAFQALTILEQNQDSPITNRVSLIYNKFSNKTGKALEESGLKNVGGAPRFEHATTEQVLKQLSSKDMFDKLV